MEEMEVRQFVEISNYKSSRTLGTCKPLLYVLVCQQKQSEVNEGSSKMAAKTTHYDSKVHNFSANILLNPSLRSY